VPAAGDNPIFNLTRSAHAETRMTLTYIAGKHAMKRPDRRQFLHLAAVAAALPVVSCAAKAQTYPSRPITMVVPFAAGGSTDTIGRVMAERMKSSLGQPVIIEDVTGAGGGYRRWPGRTGSTRRLYARLGQQCITRRGRRYLSAPI
jgi:hypothetical protein